MSETKNADMALIRAALNSLGEHFDAVQIFASRCESGEQDGTVHLNLGTGNWFSRYGQVKDWCVKEEEFARISVRSEKET